jgi:hypothetical protein
MLYDRTKRDQFKVTKVSLKTVYSDEDGNKERILVAYAGDQWLESFLLTLDRTFGDEIRRQLNSALMVTPDSDEKFWETWDYYSKRNNDYFKMIVKDEEA